MDVVDDGGGLALDELSISPDLDGSVFSLSDNLVPFAINKPGGTSFGLLRGGSPG